MADLRLQRGREHHGGPAGPEDLLHHVLRQHHVPLRQGGQRLHRLRRPVRHRHQRHPGHLRLRPAERETSQHDL